MAVRWGGGGATADTWCRERGGAGGRGGSTAVRWGDAIGGDVKRL